MAETLTRIEEWSKLPAGTRVIHRTPSGTERKATVISDIRVPRFLFDDGGGGVLFSFAEERGDEVEVLE